MRVTDKYVLFWSGEFSNFYPYGNVEKDKIRNLEPLNFENEDGIWKTSEHYFMWQKAKFFNDEKAAEAIKEAYHPSVAKMLGRGVEHFNDEAWDEVKYDAMHKAVYSKFSQIEHCKKVLLSDKYKGLHFVEASPFDNVWGIGIHFNDHLADDEKNWRGQNLLGKCLDQVREELLNNK